jgi:uncharacterized protein (TIGR02147 family)
LKAIYISLLEDEYQQRKNKNSRYSLRAFARDLGIHHTSLLSFVQEKRIISDDLLVKIMQGLQIPLHFQKVVLKDLLKFKQFKGNKKISKNLVDQFPDHLSAEEKDTAPIKEQDDSLLLLAQWYTIAIMELVELKKFQACPKWIAEKICITTDQAENALDFLLTHGFLKCLDGKYYKTHLNLSTYRKNYTTKLLKKRHARLIEKSIKSLQDDPIEFRAHHAMTIPTSRKKIEQAKTKIRDFLYELTTFLEEEEDKDDLYELQVNLFPISHLGDDTTRK